MYIQSAAHIFLAHPLPSFTREYLKVFNTSKQPPTPVRASRISHHGTCDIREKFKLVIINNGNKVDNSMMSVKMRANMKWLCWVMTGPSRGPRAFPDGQGSTARMWSKREPPES